MGSSVLQDLLKDHNSEIGDWSEIVNNHQEDSTAAESLRSRQSLYNINQDGPFYIFVSQLPTQHQPRGPDSRGLRDDVYNFFEGPKNLFNVHLYGRGCCMLRAKNFESCIQLLRKDGENYKDKPIIMEYVVPSGEHQFKYARFTSVQLDAQMEMFQQKRLNPPEEKAKPPKPNPFGDAKPADIAKKMEEVALKVQAEKSTEKRPQPPKPVENQPKYVPRTFGRSDRQHPPHPHKSDSFRDNRTPRGGGGMGGGDHHHHNYQHNPHHHHQGHTKPFTPRILSHKSNDGENIKGNVGNEIVNKSEETKGKEGENKINKNVVESGESTTITTSTTGGSTITNVTTGNTIATTSNTNGSRIASTTIKSNSNTISTAIQQQPLIEQLEQPKNFNKQEEGHIEEKNISSSTMEKKPNKKKDKKNKKTNKNQGGYNQNNRFMALHGLSEFNA
ncbi:hypothetical protein ACQ4LE_006411 [Meloidogyne hapla]|uniref:RRM domain-containing protein n=1 Tax=Meloidogyne hapla TaxID=6305 RepID=A0A1I8BXB5_MELHA